MTEESAKQKLLSVLYAFQRLPTSIQQTALLDHQFVERHKIPVTPLPFVIDAHIKVARNELFAAFARAGDGHKVEIPVQSGKGKINLRLEIAKDGAGILKIGKKKRIRIENAGLCHPSVERRRAILAKLLKRLTISGVYATEVRTLVETEPFTEDVFVNAATILNAAPEEFSAQLSSRLSRSSLGELDFLPKDPRYWEHLVPLPRVSTTLTEYVAAELKEDQCERLDASDNGMAAVSRQFAGQETVPHTWFEAQSPDTVISHLKTLLTFEDPFSLAAAFEICVRQAVRDDRYVEMGSHFLDKLFSDRSRMLDRCRLFGAMFVISTARLSLMPQFQAVPIFWKRLAAAAHSSLVVRTFGLNPPPEDVFGWAVRQQQEHYRTSVYADMWDAPRWRPEWIEAELLAADCYGRVLQALPHLDLMNKPLPDAWKERIAKAGEWMQELGSVVGAYFPSLTQGERLPRSIQPQGELLARRDQLLAALKIEPSRENLLRIGNIAEIAGVSAGHLDAVLQATRNVLTEGAIDVESYGTPATIAARIAAIGRYLPLADLVANHLLYVAQSRPRDIAVAPTFFRFLECAAADDDLHRARTTLVQRLERFALLVAPGSPASVLAHALRALRRVSQPMSELLGTAEELARLASAPARTVTSPASSSGQEAPGTV